jgi:uncharacterized membrane protein HdeD (DUF308 family)
VAAPASGPPAATGGRSATGVAAPVQSTWHRAFEVVVGLLAIGIAALALADPVLGAGLLVFLFAFALLWLGLWRVMRGQGRPDRPGWHRSLDVGLGALSVVLAFIVLLLPGLGLLTLVFLLYFALVLIGVSWIAYAHRSSSEPGWYRGLAAALGVLSFLMAIVAAVEPGIAVLTLVLLLAVVLLVIGIGDLVSGVTGRAHRMITPPAWLPKTGIP